MSRKAFSAGTTRRCRSRQRRTSARLCTSPLLRKLACQRPKQALRLVELVGTQRGAYGGDAVSQSAGAFRFRSAGSFGLLLCQPPSVSQGTRQVWAAGELVGSAGTVGQQVCTAELGCTCGGGVLRGQGARLVGEGLGCQLFGDHAQSSRFGECAFCVLALGDQGLVLRQVDGGLFAGARILPRHVLKPAAQAGQLGK